MRAGARGVLGGWAEERAWESERWECHFGGGGVVAVQVASVSGG